MEYFAACQWKAEFNARKADYRWLTEEIFGAHWRRDEWQEVLLLLIAMLADQDRRSRRSWITSALPRKSRPSTSPLPHVAWPRPQRAKTQPGRRAS